MHNPIELRPVFLILGMLISTLGAFMALPAGVDLYVRHPDWKVFAGAACVTVFVGVSMVLTNRGPRFELNRRQGFLLTALAWIVGAGFAALPFRFSGLEMSYTDAYFEAMSGFTTTGSTVITGLDSAPPGILLWRGLLQGLGGAGIIVMAMAMLPFLRVGGMQLFKMESSETSDKSFPRIKKVATAILLCYVALIVACAAALNAAGMSTFDAAVHAMTTVATGGFANSDNSIGNYPSPAVHWIITFFMAAGGAPFVIYIQAATGHWKAALRNTQLRTFLAVLTAAALVMAGWLWLANGVPPADALRLAAFNVVSITTTTGYATADYIQWGSLPVAIFFFLTFVGGCTGSTAGGIKIFRFEVTVQALRVYLWRLVYRHGVRVPTYGGRALTEDIFRGINLFVLAYLAVAAIFTLLLAGMGLDLVTAITGVVQALGNVGPGLGPIIGPAGNFASLPDGAKWILSLAMVMGRLELFTILVLIAPSFWRG